MEYNNILFSLLSHIYILISVLRLCMTALRRGTWRFHLQQMPYERKKCYCLYTLCFFLGRRLFFKELSIFSCYLINECKKFCISNKCNCSAYLFSSWKKQTEITTLWMTCLFPKQPREHAVGKRRKYKEEKQSVSTSNLLHAWKSAPTALIAVNFLNILLLQLAPR